MPVAASLRQALVLAFSAKYVVTLIQFAMMVIVARILAPEDIGIYSVAAVFAGIAYLLRDFGVANYIVQERELTRDRLKAAYLVNVLMACVVATILWVASGPIAGIYEEDGVADLLKLACLQILLIPVGATTMAFLKREMAFSSIVRADILSTLVNAVVTIAAAYLGAEYLAMAFGAISGIVVTILYAQIIRPDFVPLLPGAVSQVRHVIGYSTVASAAQIVRHAGESSTSWILGRSMGMHPVGIISRGEGTTQIFDRLIMEGIQHVFAAYFATLNRAGEEMKARYLYASSSLLCIAWPFYAVVALLAVPTIHVLYGDQWFEVAELLPWLCLWRAFYSMTAVADPVLLGLGEVRALLRIQVVTNVGRIGLIILAMTESLMSVVILLALVHGPLRLFSYYVPLRRLFGITALDYVKSSWRPLCFAACAAVVPAIVDWSLDDPDSLQESLWLLTLGGAGAAVAWAAGVLSIGHPMLEELLRLPVVGPLLHRIGGRSKRRPA